jgi:hypothetical protein
MVNNHKSGSINFKMILILTLILAGFIYYWYITKDSLSETYKIKSAGGESGYEQTYINRTGKDVEEKEIKLSDDYWTGGKFGF